MPVYSKHLKIVLKGLKYKTLNNLIGSEIEICSLESVESDIFSILGGELPIESSLISPNIEGVMAKYGFIDAEFSISNRNLRNYPRVNRKVLEDLYFVFEKGSKESFKDEDALFAFEELVEDIKENEAYIKLFLEIENRKQFTEDRSTHTPENLPKYIPRLPKFPKIFKVTDACLTNSDFVWINKHFYL